MSMFTRSDKLSDPAAGANPSPREAAPQPVAPTAPQTAAQTAPRPQASAQPLSQIAAQGTRPQMGVSVISKALKITGQLESTEDIQIDGDVEGDVRGVSVRIGSGATIKGTVYGDAVELSGTIDGRIEAKTVVLTATAHMSGDVVHQDIRVESGAFIDGHCKPESAKASAKAPAHKPASESASAAKV